MLIFEKTLKKHWQCLHAAKFMTLTHKKKTKANLFVPLSGFALTLIQI